MRDTPDTLQIAATTVTTMLTHTPSQISGGGGGGSSGGGESDGSSGGGGPPGGQPPVQAAAAPASPANNRRGLVGEVPIMFDGSRSKSETFIQEFEQYAHVNEDNHAFIQPFKRIFLALFYMKGPKVNDWVRLIRE